MNKKLLKQIKDQDIETSIRQGLMDEHKKERERHYNPEKETPMETEENSSSKL